MLAIANGVIDKGYSVIYGSSQNFLKQIEDEAKRCGMKGKRAVADYIADINKRAEKDKKSVSPKELQSLPVLQLINEAFARGIKFLPVDLEKSSDVEYLPEDGKIRMPFSALAGLGENAAANITAAREEAPIFSVEDLRTRAKLTTAVIDILRANGVLDGLNETDQLTMNFGLEPVQTTTPAASAPKEKAAKPAADTDAGDGDGTVQISMF